MTTRLDFYGRTDIFKHHMSALKNGAKMQIVVLKMLRYHGNKARNVLILFHFLFKDTLVFSYKKFRKNLNVKSISSTYL